MKCGIKRREINCGSDRSHHTGVPCSCNGQPQDQPRRRVESATDTVTADPNCAEATVLHSASVMEDGKTSVNKIEHHASTIIHRSRKQECGGRWTATIGRTKMRKESDFLDESQFTSLVERREMTCGTSKLDLMRDDNTRARPHKCAFQMPSEDCGRATSRLRSAGASSTVSTSCRRRNGLALPHRAYNPASTETMITDINSPKAVEKVIVPSVAILLLLASTLN
eukprot:COSAG02_NODE_1515_length_12187_cov_37.042025_6_plen_225_part_00